LCQQYQQIIKLKGFFLLEIIKPTHLETKFFADIGGFVEHHFSNFLRPEKDFFQLKIIKHHQGRDVCAF
jgi:hypothetical protein